MGMCLCVTSVTYYYYYYNDIVLLFIYKGFRGFGAGHNFRHKR